MASKGRHEEPDELDAMLDVWAREIPGLDPLNEGIVERIHKLARSFDRSMDETLAETGLDRDRDIPRVDLAEIRAKAAGIVFDIQ